MNNFDFARFFMDAKAQKATKTVTGGDGLRIPVSMSPMFQCLFPPLWIARRVEGETPETLAVECAEKFAQLLVHLGGSSNLRQRDCLGVEQMSTVNIFFNKSLIPKSRREWERLFTPPLAWLKVALVIAYPSKAKVVETLIATAKTTIKKGGFVGPGGNGDGHGSAGN